MKIWTVILLSLFAQSIVCAQTRVVAECTVNYSIQIKGDAKMDNETAALLKSSSKIVYIKGNDSRVDLLSTTFLQTLIYDKSTGTAVIMRELGANKFMTKLDNKAWANQNSKYTGMVITYLDEVKQILGYECKKAILQLNDGNTFSVYYATAITPSVREFEFQFKDIPGFVLEYETVEGKGEKITFTATKINLNPVPASKFDIPTSGYRLLN
jgi:GLPGLI family protein